MNAMPPVVPPVMGPVEAREECDDGEASPGGPRAPGGGGVELVDVEGVEAGCVGLRCQ